jgi:hypothetical protein
MKVVGLIICLSLIIISCNKEEKNQCTDCDLIREFKVNTILPQKYNQDTVFVYDILTTNFCKTESKHYLFESNTFYKNKINECLNIECTTDSKGTQKCEIL